MGEFSLSHILIVALILLVFFGPSRLPGLGKSLGEAIRGFKKGLDGEPVPPDRQISQADKSSDPHVQMEREKQKQTES